TINKATVTLDTTIHDATTNGAPTGNLGESVYDTVGLTGSQVFFSIADVTYTFDGNSAGSGAQSATKGPLHAGLHHFQAHFAGNSDRKTADKGNEPLTINKATVTLDTTIYDSVTDNAPTNALGESVYD